MANECKNCFAYKPLSEESNIGHCRLYPPDGTHNWPEVKDWDWCGQFVWHPDKQTMSTPETRANMWAQ